MSKFFCFKNIWYIYIIIAKLHDINEDDIEKLCKNDKLNEEILKNFDKFGRSNGLRGFEIVKKIHIEPVEEGFTVEKGFVTPTFKLKRTTIQRKYETILNSLYK